MQSFLNKFNFRFDYELRQILGFSSWIIFFFALMTYFLFHAIKGDRGILAWSELEYKLLTKEKELAKVEEEWNTLDQNVKKLKDVICSDLLEEQSIRILGFSYPGDIVLIDE